MVEISVLMTLSSYRGYGGHEIVINNLCKGLHNLGYHTAIGAFSFAEDPPIGIRKVKLSRIQSFEHNNGTNFDIIHNHQTMLNYYSILSSKPFIFHYHGAANKAQEINLRLSMMLCGRKIKIISVSNSGVKHLEQILGQTSANVLYNGVDITAFNTNLPRPYTKGDPQLLFVGVMYPTKNITFLIEKMPEILKLYPEAHLQIIGEGKEYSSLQQVIKQKGLDRNIELIGRLHGNELPLWYSSCDIYVSASNRETLPLPPLEALACGKPVLLSDIPPHKEIVDISAGGLTFDLNNTSDMLDKIKLVYEEKKNFGFNGRLFAKQYSWPEVCKRLSAIYSEILL